VWWLLLNWLGLGHNCNAPEPDRSRLLDALDRAVARGVIVISVPAGTGKTSCSVSCPVGTSQDVDDVPESVRAEIHIHPVSTVAEVLPLALSLDVASGEGPLQAA
jgi:Lon protease-like protein